MSNTVDLRALLDARVKGDKRATVRHVFCLDPQVYADLADLRDRERELITQSFRSNDTDNTSTDERYSQPSELDTVREQIATLEASIVDVSVVGVFKALSESKFYELLDQFEVDSDADPKDQRKAKARQDHAVISTSFDRFERDGQRIPDDEFGKHDLAQLLTVMSRGEVASLAQKVTGAAVADFDVPFSVTESLNQRRSAQS